MSTVINTGEYGIALNFNANYNLSSATTLSLSVVRPDNSAFVAQPTRGTVDLVTTDVGTYLANQYATYIFQSGDLSVAGTYFVRMVYLDPSKRLVSDVTTFVVQP